MTKYEAGFRLGVKMMGKEASILGKLDNPITRLLLKIPKRDTISTAIRNSAGINPTDLSEAVSNLIGTSAGGFAGHALRTPVGRGIKSLVERLPEGISNSFIDQYVDKIVGPRIPQFGAELGSAAGSKILKKLHSRSLSTPQKLLAGGLDFAEENPKLTAGLGLGAAGLGTGLAGYGAYKAVSDDD